MGFSEGHQVGTGESKKGIYVGSLPGMSTSVVGPLNVILFRDFWGCQVPFGLLHR